MAKDDNKQSWWSFDAFEFFMALVLAVGLMLWASEEIGTQIGKGVKAYHEAVEGSDQKN